MPEMVPSEGKQSPPSSAPAAAQVDNRLANSKRPFRPNKRNGPNNRFRGPRKQLPQLAGVVIVKDQTILLLRRSKTGWLELPGGKVEPDEDSLHAAIREASEEIGAKVRAVKELGKDHFFQNGCKRHYTWYLCELLPGEEPKLGEPQKFKQWQYVPLSELENAHLHPNMKKFVKRWKKGKIDLGIPVPTSSESINPK